MSFGMRRRAGYGEEAVQAAGDCRQVAAGGYFCFGGVAYRGCGPLDWCDGGHVLSWATEIWRVESRSRSETARRSRSLSASSSFIRFIYPNKAIRPFLDIFDFPGVVRARPVVDSATWHSMRCSNCGCATLRPVEKLTQIRSLWTFRVNHKL